MTPLYYRRSKPRVAWNPEDRKAGKNAVTNVVGDITEWPARVSNDEAERIRDEYAELIADTTTE